MDQDFVRTDFQDAWTLGELSEIPVVLAVVVVRFFKGLQRLIEPVACGDAPEVHQALALRFQFHHRRFNHRLQT